MLGGVPEQTGRYADVGCRLLGHQPDHLRRVVFPGAHSMDVDSRARAAHPVECEANIAVELQDSLRDSGFSVAGPFANARREAWLGAGTPHAAILHHALKDGPCDALVAELSRRGGPTLIFTGHDAPREMLAEVHAATWITKPVTSPEPISALARAQGSLKGGEAGDAVYLGDGFPVDEGQPNGQRLRGVADGRTGARTRSAYRSRPTRTHSDAGAGYASSVLGQGSRRGPVEDSTL